MEQNLNPGLVLSAFEELGPVQYQSPTHLKFASTCKDNLNAGEGDKIPLLCENS